MYEIRSMADMQKVLQQMRDELTAVGCTELRTPEAVDDMMKDQKGTALVVINSVCGCAAGNARPGVGLALQNTKIPDTMYTVFAGQDKPATERLREHIPAQPPSSPSVCLFKDGTLVYMMHRYMIEGRDAIQVAGDLIGQFNAHCEKEGPSISKEEFQKMPYAQYCGSMFQ
jgi:putative YphP/YqiW family bacilliredoxin